MFKKLLNKKKSSEIKLSYTLPDIVCDIEISKELSQVEYLKNYLNKIGYKQKEINKILEQNNPFDYIWKVYSMSNTNVTDYNMFLIQECERKAIQIKLLIIENKIDFHIITECFWYFMFFIELKLRYNIKNNTIDMREFEYFIKGLYYGDNFIFSSFDVDIINALAIYSKCNSKTIVEVFKLMFSNLNINKQYFSKFLDKIGGDKYLEVIFGRILELLIADHEYISTNILINK